MIHNNFMCIFRLTKSNHNLCKIFIRIGLLVFIIYIEHRSKQKNIILLRIKNEKKT
jgi:hypothetical protein